MPIFSVDIFSAGRFAIISYVLAQVISDSKVREDRCGKADMAEPRETDWLFGSHSSGWGLYLHLRLGFFTLNGRHIVFKWLLSFGLVWLGKYSAQAWRLSSIVLLWKMKDDTCVRLENILVSIGCIALRIRHLLRHAPSFGEVIRSTDALFSCTKN
jgi:hypothetical protein